MSENRNSAKTTKTKCNNCQTRIYKNHSFCRGSGNSLNEANVRQVILQDRWALVRDQISFAVCVVSLLALIGTCSYILINAGSFPREVTISVTSLSSLSLFAFIGYITNTPSILRAVASAIINISFNREKQKKPNRPRRTKNSDSNTSQPKQ
jgi:ABC-type uncharacterized transport system fused permease/ATPase subunit